jgi:mannosyltransferase OCH1-like enzyme
MIPKIVHYVWVGPKPLPEDAKELIAGWRELMPEWRFLCWSEDNIDFSPLFVRQAHGVRAYNRVANYARLAALKEYGGFYFDHDIRLLKSVEPLCSQPGVLGFQTDTDAGDLVNNAFIGAVPDHPFICRALAALDAMDGSFDWGANTGPGLLTRLLRESDGVKPSPDPYLASGMMLYPPRYFYPYPWDGKYTPECVKPDTVAIHLWEHTWKAAPGRIAKVTKQCRKVLTSLFPTMMSSIVKARDTRARNRLRTDVER